MTKNDAYQTITDSVISLMESSDLAPWRKTWKGSTCDGARSMATGKLYQGSNALWLTLLNNCAGYSTSYWGTYRQISALGGQVRKGEKSACAVYWKFLERTDERGNEQKIPMLRTFSIFNADQADWPEGIPTKFDAEIAAEESEWDGMTSNEIAQAIADGYLEGGPALTHGGSSACYLPTLDKVRMPKAADFVGEGEYYSTLFHELGHSTGHSSRLARPGVVDFDRFGSHQYSEEELVAEFTACYLSTEAGIVDTRANSAAYLKSWAKVLKADPKMLIRAAGRAAKAADLIKAGSPAQELVGQEVAA